MHEGASGPRIKDFPDEGGHRTKEGALFAGLDLWYRDYLL